MLRGLSIKAVLIGLVLDWLLSFLLGIVLAVGLIIVGLLTTHDATPLADRIIYLAKSNLDCLINCVVGGIASILPGFVVGWISKTHRVKNATLTGVLSAVTSLVLLPFSSGYPVWFWPASLVVTIVGCGLGGFLADLILGEAAPPPP
jgi:hypothetical protein